MAIKPRLGSVGRFRIGFAIARRSEHARQCRHVVGASRPAISARNSSRGSGSRYACRSEMSLEKAPRLLCGAPVIREFEGCPGRFYHCSGPMDARLPSPRARMATAVMKAFSYRVGRMINPTSAAYGSLTSAQKFHFLPIFKGTAKAHSSSSRHSKRNAGRLPPSAMMVGTQVDTSTPTK